VGTTIQVQHLPPLITSAAREGLLAASQARDAFLAREIQGDALQIREAHAKLVGLILAAHKAGNFRDYLCLLIEKAMLGLSTGTGIPEAPLLEIALLVNPFLDKLSTTKHFEIAANHAFGEPLRTLTFASVFRQADLEHVAEDEKDLMVLLFYCCRLHDCADEAVDFVRRIAEKAATPSILERKKESFSEIDVRSPPLHTSHVISLTE